MPTYLTRVELHKTALDDRRDLYAELHGHMEQQGFARYVNNAAGKHQLPTGIYVIDSKLSCSEVRDKAVFAAKRTGHPYEVFACDFTTWASTNLKQIT